MTNTRSEKTLTIRRLMPVILAAGLLCTSSASAAATWYVAPNGSNTNPGTEANPFKTVQKGIERAAAGDTVYIKAGTYDLSGFSRTVDRPITLIGQDKNSTVLTKGELTFSKSVTVKNLKFSGGPVLRLSPQKGETLDGVFIENCVFEKFWAGIYARYYEGVITNVTISNCEFLNMESGKVVAICLGTSAKDDSGKRRGPSNVKITNNSFRNLKSTNKGCMAVYLGDRDTTKNVLISENYMDTIIGPPIIGASGPEVHGILVYGTNIRILKNTVKNLNRGTDHEAIYMKARDSVIADNVVANCGSAGGGADIASKGGEFSVGNVYTGNRITGDLPGRGMLINGGAVVKNNYVKKTNGSNGIDVYSLGKPVTIEDNYAETRYGAGIYVNGGDFSGRPFKWPNPGLVVVSNNVAISYEGPPIKVVNVGRTKVSGNKERKGRK